MSGGATNSSFLRLCSSSAVAACFLSSSPTTFLGELTFLLNCGSLDAIFNDEQLYQSESRRRSAAVAEPLAKSDPPHPALKSFGDQAAA